MNHSADAGTALQGVPAAVSVSGSTGGRNMASIATEAHLGHQWMLRVRLVVEER
jgi:hypothetical protein